MAEQTPLETGSSQPIIIKKKKGGDGGHHGGAWKVAYADFVTAMMALFIVLWVLGQSEEVKQAVSAYFNDPIGFSQNKGKNIINLGGGPGKNNANPKFTQAQLDSIERKKIEMEAKAAEKRKLAETAKNILRQISENPQFSIIEDKIKISLVDEGLKIEMLESDDFFFEVGTAKLKKNAEMLLRNIGKELGTLNEKIVIAGHTDARPYSNNGAGYSNFELSADRANAARKALIAGGLQMEQIDEIRGFADTRLKDPDDPYSAINRRIEIIVKYLK